MSYVFPFVEGDMCVGAVRNNNINICFPLMLWIPSMMCMLGSFPFFGILITDEVGHMSLRYTLFDLDRYDTIVSGWYLKC